jgi:hypothetical protein
MFTSKDEMRAVAGRLVTEAMENIQQRALIENLKVSGTDADLEQRKLGEFERTLKTFDDDLQRRTATQGRVG